jgi:hypothetical protein
MIIIPNKTNNNDNMIKRKMITVTTITRVTYRNKNMNRTK